MFKLPNGKPVDLTMVELAMEDSDFESSAYLNIQTGEVTFISENIQTSDEMEKLLDEIEGNSDYVLIEKFTSDEEYRWMEDFVTDIVAPQNEHIAEKLLSALHRSKPFRHFKDALHTSGDKWQKAWYHQRDEYLHKALAEWLMSLPIEITEE